MKVMHINSRDNVAVAIKVIPAGHTISVSGKTVTVSEPISPGHKVALAMIPQGSAVIKYGFPIGIAVSDIQPGEWVHAHNLKTGLSGKLDYRYQPENDSLKAIGSTDTFNGYLRPDGKAGTRNEIWIIPTVGCVNRNAQLIAAEATKRLSPLSGIDGIYAFPHPYGCSQLGEDERNTQKILANLVRHPNAGGVLVLGLGCENNNITVFREIVGPDASGRIEYLEAQSVADEIEEGVSLVKKLVETAGRERRQPCPVSKLVVGLKCGGSDGFSGITANPLAGEFSDRLVAAGGSTVLTEVPEMFGAETILMNRAQNEAVFNKIVGLINNFKDFYAAHNQPIYENPSPGNKAGGITTLEEKSLGCTQKGGFRASVIDVLAYGETVSRHGLNLLSGPGNDMVACTVLAAAGCQIILFTTGRGTPLGTVVPTYKIATNSELFRKKTGWLDFDAGQLMENVSLADLADTLYNEVLAVASGKNTKAENMGFKDLSIFKTGVTL